MQLFFQMALLKKTPRSFYTCGMRLVDIAAYNKIAIATKWDKHLLHWRCLEQHYLSFTQNFNGSHEKHCFYKMEAQFGVCF